MDVAAWVREHASTAAFLQRRPPTQRTAYASSLIDKVRRIKVLHADDAKVMVDAVAAGEWPEEDLQSIGHAIEDRLLGLSRKTVTRDNQDTQFELFLRPSDWGFIADIAGTMTAKIAHMRKVMRQSGVILPSEKLKARMANLLRLRGTNSGEKWTPAEWGAHLDRVKLMLESNQKAPVAKFMAPYPLTPRDLLHEAPDMYNAFYAQEGPDCRECPELGDYPYCRKSHNQAKTNAAVDAVRLVRPDPVPESALVTKDALTALFGANSAASFSSASWRDRPSDYGPSWRDGPYGWGSRESWRCDPWGGNAAARGGGDGSEWEPVGSWKPAASLLAIADEGASAAGIQLSLEQDEVELRHALLRRAEERKQLKEEKKGAEPHESVRRRIVGKTNFAAGARAVNAKKRRTAGARAAKAKKPRIAMAKRPAAAERMPATRMLVNPRWGEPGDAKRSRNTYCCKWYNRAEQAAKSAGLSEADMRKQRSSTHARAGEVWDAHN